MSVLSNSWELNSGTMLILAKKAWSILEEDVDSKAVKPDGSISWEMLYLRFLLTVGIFWVKSLRSEVYIAKEWADEFVRQHASKDLVSVLQFESPRRLSSSGKPSR